MFEVYSQQFKKETEKDTVEQVRTCHMEEQRNVILWIIRQKT